MSLFYDALRTLPEPAKRSLSITFRKACESVGLLVARKNDCYTPLPSSFDLQTTLPRWNRPSALHGVKYDLEKMKALFAALLSQHLQEFLSASAARGSPESGVWRGLYGDGCLDVVPDGQELET